MEVSVSQRLKQFLRYNNISNRAFEIKCGLYNGYVKDVKIISPNKIGAISLHYPELNMAWLLTGVGEMLNTPQQGTNITINRGGDVSGTGNASAVGASTASVVSAKPTDEAKDAPKGIPYYDIEPASCGALSGFGEALTMNNPSGTVVIPTLRTQDGDFFLATRGNSMVDTLRPERSIPDGSMLLVREWRRNYIEWGEIYCVMTADGYIIKKLLPGEDESKIRCVSSNTEEYPPYEILREDIRGLGRVVAAVTTRQL